MSKPTIDTAVGIVLGLKQSVLIAKRPETKSFPGFWEFPGGKIELNETPEQALVRELQEEINIIPTQFEQLCLLKHDYPERFINLNTYVITAFEGDPIGLENQEIRWVQKEDFANYHFLPANETLIRLLLEYLAAHSSENHYVS
jgi:8-oxo-dGTP diphosphatase